MSIFQRVAKNARRRDLVVLVVVGLLTAALAFFLVGRRRYANVYVTNGLDEAVTVNLDGNTVSVPTGGFTKIGVGSGAKLAQASIGSRVVENVVVDCDPAADAVIYNVLGAAPVLQARITYSATRAGLSGDEVNFLAGDRRTAVVSSADYVFVEPPKTISTKSHGDVTKSLVTMPRGGWQGTISYLLSKKRYDDAVALSRRMVWLDPKSVYTAHFADSSAHAVYGVGGAAAMLAPLLRRPEVDKENIARTIMFDACRTSACDDVAALVLRVLPEQIDGQLLAMRALPEAPYRAKLAEIVAAHPDDPAVRSVQGWLAYVDGDYDRCITLFSRPPRREFDVDELATCLFMKGKVDDALTQLREVASGGGPAAHSAAITYARIASEAKKPAFGPLDKVEGPSSKKDEGIGRDAARDLWLAKTTKNTTVSSESDKALAAAVGLAKKALSGPPFTLPEDMGGYVPDVLLLLVGAESARLGDLATARKAFALAPRFPLPEVEVIAYVLDGTLPRGMFRLPPDDCAALEFVRSRRLYQQGLEDESKALAAAARKRDPLHGWVSRVAESWPLPSVKTSVVVYGTAPAAPNVAGEGAPR